MRELGRGPIFPTIKKQTTLLYDYVEDAAAASASAVEASSGTPRHTEKWAYLGRSLDREKIWNAHS